MAILLVFGDSIAWGAWDPEGGGWVQRLKRTIDRKTLQEPDFHTLVYNLGISGNDTDALVERFLPEAQQRLRETEEEAVVLFAIGINDSQYIQSQKTNRVPLDRFEQNLRVLMEQSRRIARQTLFLEITPVDESRTAPVLWNPDKFYTHEHIQKYNRVLRSLCFEYEIPLVELYQGFLKQGHVDLLWDGLHPNTRGHQWIAQRVEEFLFGRGIL